MAEEKPKQGLNAEQAGALFDRSKRWIQERAKEGWFKSDKGKFELVQLCRGVVAYFDDLQAKSEKKAAATRVTDARTREIEMRIAERQRELIPLEDARNLMGQFAALVRAELTGLPARMTRDKAERKKLEKDVDDALRRLSSKAQKAAAALEAGSSDLGASGEVSTGSVGGGE